MITVITSTYNRAKRLKKSIQSVLDQSYKDFEYIIVDDCSTDNTEWTVKKFKDKRIRYIRLPENTGHDGRPKNVGIKEAKGEYVAFLDDDDLYYKDTLKVLYTYMKYTNADMVYGDYINFYEKDGHSEPGWNLDFNLQNLTNFNFITTGSGMVKTERLRKIGGFNENIPRFKDWNLWLRLAKDGCTIIHVPIPTLKLIAHEKTISQKYHGQTEYDENGRYKATFFNPADCKIYADKTVMGEANPLKVAVITMTLDRLDYTKKMYNAMKNTAGYDFDWFVLDQGSKDGTKDFLKGKCTLIEEEKNIGIAKGWMKLVDRVKKDYQIVIKIDNDCEMMTNNWLKDMIEVFESNKRVILSPYIEGLDNSPGGVIRSRPDGKSPYVLITDRVMGMVPNLGGIVFASPVELYEGFSFPEDLEGNKDYYLSQYARSLGYNLLYMEEYRAAHIDSTAGQHAKYPEYFKTLYGK
jgi:glycosyltransferase involved in cell wall biosynthesis